jgi:hypothetical protein
MTSTAPAEPAAHPILGFAAALGGALDRVLRVEAVFMTSEEKRAALIELDRQRARLDALALRVLAAADLDDVGAASGASSTGAWLSHETRADRSEAVARVKLAQALDRDRQQTAAGLGAGEFSVEHAKVIVHAIAGLADLADLADLSGDLDAGLVESAEKTMVEEARHLTPKQLRTVGKHLVVVIAPDEAEARLGVQLDRAEAAAIASARFTMRPNGDGTSTGWFRVPDLHASILKTAIEAIIAPRKQQTNDKSGHRHGQDQDQDFATRMGLGLCELLEHLPTNQLGEHGGTAATLVITLDYETLQTGLGTAALPDGTTISAGQARRLACGAGLIPAVLGGTSAVLDLGREARLFSKAQRIAMGLRDHGCRAETCDRPPPWCEAHHHQTPWSQGGKTNLADGILLCGYHHRLAHRPDYHHHRLPNGDIRFNRRT